MASKKKQSRQELKDRMVDTFVEYARLNTNGVPPGDRSLDAHESAYANMTAVIDVLRSVLKGEQDPKAAKNIRGYVKRALDTRRCIKDWIKELKRRQVT